MRLVGFVVNPIELKILFRTDADGTDNSVFDVVKFVEADLFAYSFNFLVELSEEIAGQMEPVLYVII